MTRHRPTASRGGNPITVAGNFPKKGDAAPDFAAKDLDGNVAVLSSLGNGPIILRFFESNCRFCKADTPMKVSSAVCETRRMP